MKMIFYNKVDAKLKKWINYYWTLTGSIDDNLYEILPMDHSDIIINLMGNFHFELNDKIIQPSSVFFHGMKTQPMYLRQRGESRSVGISFKPWGLYAFIPQVMADFIDQVVDVHGLNKVLAGDLEDFAMGQSFDLEALEKILIHHLSVATEASKDLDVIEDFLATQESIETYAKRKHLSRRTLERHFKKYVGLSPSKIRQVQKFEDTARNLLFLEEVDMSDIALDDYFDQAHMSKHFKKFSKKSPKKFVTDKTALKSRIDYE